MDTVPNRTKSLLTVLICLGLVILAVIIFATSAMGAAKFITTPIGYAPPAPPRVMTWKTTRMPPKLIHALRHPPKPAPVVLRAPTRLPEARPSGGCYWEPGTPPAYIMRAENRGGSPTQMNLEGSSAAGCWQIVKGTWNGYGGYASAADAPVKVQNAKAKELWAGGAGCSHWEQTANEC